MASKYSKGVWRAAWNPRRRWWEVLNGRRDHRSGVGQGCAAGGRSGMKRDSNGHIVPEPNAPKTRTGKVAAVIFAIVVSAWFIVGCLWLGALLLHAIGALS